MEDNDKPKPKRRGRKPKNEPQAAAETNETPDVPTPKPKRKRKLSGGKPGCPYGAVNNPQGTVPYLMRPGFIERLETIFSSSKTQEELLIDGLASGVPLQVALDYAGISHQSWRNWEAQYNEDPDNAPEEYKRFIKVARQAAAAKAVWAQNMWFRAASGELKGARWEGFATYLERLLHKHYAQIRHTKDQAPVIQINGVSNDADAAVQANAELAKRYQLEHEQKQKQEQQKVEDNTIDVEFEEHDMEEQDNE